MRKRGVGLTLLGRALVWRLLGIISRHSELWEKLFTLCHSVLDVIHGVEVSSCELCYAFGGCTAEKSFGNQLIVKVQGCTVRLVENHQILGFSSITTSFG